MTLEPRSRRLAMILILGASFTQILLCNLSSPLAAQASDPLMVVVSLKNTPGESLNKASVKKILLGDITNWPDGSQIPVIMGPPGDSDRAAALKALCSLNESLFTRRQLQASFSGGTPVVIREVQSPAEMKSALRSNPMGIGFLHKRDIDGTVKALFAVE